MSCEPLNCGWCNTPPEHVTFRGAAGFYSSGCDCPIADPSRIYDLDSWNERQEKIAAALLAMLREAFEAGCLDECAWHQSFGPVPNRTKEEIRSAADAYLSARAAGGK